MGPIYVAFKVGSHRQIRLIKDKSGLYAYIRDAACTSFDHNSMSISPKLVRTTTFPLVGGSEDTQELFE